MKTNTYLKALVVLLALCFNLSLKAQCNASFTYTLTGNQLSMTNTSTGTTGNTSYWWSWYSQSASGWSSQQNPVANLTYNGSYVIYLSIYDSIGNCNSTAVDSFIFSGGQNCQVSFTYTVGSSGLVNFTNTSSGSTVYYWNFGDGNSSSQASPSNTYQYNGTYTVSLWSDTTGGGCYGYTQTVITINNATPCNINAGFTSSNNGTGLFIFTDTVTTNTGTNMIHTWYVNGSYVGSGNPFTYQFNANGYFNVCETIQDSSFMGGGTCGATTCDSVATSNVACTDSAYFFLYPDSTQTGTWYAWLYATNYNNIVNAVWSWGDGTTSTGIYPTHTYTAAGWYTICVTTYFACGDSSYYCQTDSMYKAMGMVTVNVISGVSGINNQNNTSMTSLKAYPNPFNEDLTVNFTSYENKTITYVMYDMMGNQLLKETVSAHKGDNEVKINTGSISHGVYFINLSGADGKKASTIKVVK